LLGRFVMDNITPAPRGVPKLLVTYDIDVNGILKVTALDKGTDKTKQINISNDRGRLSKTQIDDMIVEATRLQKEDENNIKRISAINNIENLLYTIKKEVNSMLPEQACNTRDLIERTSAWVDNNRSATTEEIEHEMEICQSRFNEIRASNTPGSGSGSRTVEDEDEDEDEEDDHYGYSADPN